MKRLNLTIITVLILILSLSINTISCSASEPYYTDLVEAELAIQESIEMYNFFLSSDIVKTSLDDINSYKNVFVYCSPGTSSSSVIFYCSNDDFVVYKYGANGVPVLGVLSEKEINYKSFVFQARHDDLNPDGTARVIKNATNENVWDSVNKVGGITYYSSSFWSSPCRVGSLARCDVQVYQDANEAAFALQGNDIKPLYSPVATPSDYSSELYFKSFEVIPHTSNSGKKYYFDIKYELSEYAKAHIEGLNLDFQNCYSIDTDAPLDTKFSRRTTPWKSNQISLQQNPNGFSIYVTDLGCYRYAYDTWGLSANHFIGVDALSPVLNFFVGVVDIDFDFAYCEQAKLYCKFSIRAKDDNGKLITGKRNDFTWNFLDKTLEKYIYTPSVITDSDGNTTLVKDSNGNITYTQEGDKITSNDYYYNYVETDDDNTVINNYFYYDSNGNEKEITEDEYKDNAYTVINAGGGSGGNASVSGIGATANAIVGDININVNTGQGEYVNVDPKDYKVFIDAIKDLLGEFDEKGGLALLLKDTFSIFPDRVWIIVSAGISAMVVVSIICILRR